MTDLECRGVIVRTHVLRSFVATQEMADTVPRSMTIGDTCFPHILFGECIQLITARTSWETCPCEGDMSFKDIGIVQFGLLRNTSAEPNGAGDIRRSVQVLPTGVEKQHTFRFDNSAVVFGRGIMHDGPVAQISGNRPERFFNEVLSHRPELMQFLHQRPFGLGLTIRKSFLIEPFEETGEGYGILAHCNPFTFQFDGVFLCFIDEDG